MTSELFGGAAATANNQRASHDAQNIARCPGDGVAPAEVFPRRRRRKPSRKPHVHVKQAGKIHCTAVYITPDDRDGEGTPIRCKDSRNAHRLKAAVRDAYERGRLDGIKRTHEAIPRYVVADTTRPIIAAFDDEISAHNYKRRLGEVNPMGNYWVTDLLQDACKPQAQMHAQILIDEVAAAQEARSAQARKARAE